MCHAHKLLSQTTTSSCFGNSKYSRWSNPNESGKRTKKNRGVVFIFGLNAYYGYWVVYLRKMLFLNICYETTYMLCGNIQAQQRREQHGFRDHEQRTLRHETPTMSTNHATITFIPVGHHPGRRVTDHMPEDHLIHYYSIFKQSIHTCNSNKNKSTHTHVPPNSKADIKIMSTIHRSYFFHIKHEIRTDISSQKHSRYGSEYRWGFWPGGTGVAGGKARSSEAATNCDKNQKKREWGASTEPTNSATEREHDSKMFDLILANRVWQTATQQNKLRKFVVCCMLSVISLLPCLSIAIWLKIT